MTDSTHLVYVIFCVYVRFWLRECLDNQWLPVKQIGKRTAGLDAMAKNVQITQNAFKSLMQKEINFN